MSKTIVDILAPDQSELINDWVRLQMETLSNRRDRIPESQLRANAHDFLITLTEAVGQPGAEDIYAPRWTRVRDMLASLSRQRAMQGFTPAETASFVFSLKQPLFNFLRRAYKDDPDGLGRETWAATTLLDRLGLYTTEVFQKSREEIIARQQQEMMELSTPVVELWQGILALPLIGTLDSARTQVVMQNLLEAIVAKSADIAIIDITGVPTVDTLVAQHLLKTVAAARLMGAECLISGIRPQIAQTIIHLGVDLGGVITKATLADAFQLALNRKQLSVKRG
ncbi:MAG TPA: STAS domain-containing protein [Bryobacteraceae bacterium]|nr:STAS domain-containing protein [Bryobacteraceae bacterium]